VARSRYEFVGSALGKLHGTVSLPSVHIGAGLRRALASGYAPASLWRDALAGLVVSVIALPLNIALAIALGVRPEAGVYAAVVAGVVAALAGGSRYQVTGPTAVLVVILTPAATEYGLKGLAVATMGAGVILLAMGLLRLGRLIEFIPFPVTTAFTAGIGLVIATLQVKDFFGLHELVGQLPLSFVERVGALWRALLAKFSGAPGIGMFDELLIASLTLTVLVLWPRAQAWIGRRLKLNVAVPGPLVALPLAAVVAWACAQGVDGFAVDTIRTRFAIAGAPHGLSQSLPPLLWPWHEPGPVVGGVEQTVSLTDRHAAGVLLSTCFGIAMLGAIATLLSAVVADGMAGDRHDPNAELVGQGLANLLVPFVGGFAVTGAIARTVSAVRAGAQSPLASCAQAMALAGMVVVGAPLLGHLPMAALAALLVHVARGMVQTQNFVFLLRYAPRRDAAVLVVCFGLTVLVDMATAVSAGVVMAAMLFMLRMAETSHVALVGADHPVFSQPVPAGVVVYDVGGPLFFGAAGKAVATLAEVGASVRGVVLNLTDVSQIDATGLVNLDSVVQRLRRRGVLVVLAAAPGETLSVLEHAGWLRREGLVVAGSVNAGVEVCRAWLGE
jgi:SulP family sulfate permease